MSSPPGVVVLDVNETLSDLAPMADRLTDVGAPGHLLPTWFAGVLRDGFALTVVGADARFADLGASVLRQLLGPLDLDRDLDAAVEHVMAGFSALAPHPDVVPGLTALADAGWRVVTLSNGAAGVARGLLERAGAAHLVEQVLSVEDAGVWKPAAGAYAYAARCCGVEPAAMVLAAVHPWDVDGAQRAGLTGAWVDRGGTPYPAPFLPPDVRVDALTGLAAALADRR